MWSSANSFIQRFRTSRLRQIIWPVRSHELMKFVPMALLMFTILLNQNIVRSVKDSLVMTYIGPEVISFIKLWGEMPAGILFVIVYTKLCNKMSTERVFRLVVLFFLVCFAFFSFVVFPHHEFFHPNPSHVQDMAQTWPHLRWFLMLWGKWSFCVFYVLGELWPIVVFSLLYWQLANKITRTEEASRFYSFFSLFGQTNLLVSGTAIMYFAKGDHFLSGFFKNIHDPTEVMLKSLMIIVLISGCICLIIHRLIEKKIVLNPKYGIVQVGQPAPKLKLSLGESTRLIMKSKYLWLICMLLIGYSMSINFIEGLWMAKVRERYTDAQQFISYHGNVLFWTGVFTLVCSFIGSSIIRYFGWFWGAVSTPLMIMIFGGIFFVFVALQDKLELLSWFDPLAIIVWIGGLQHVLGKGTKYSLFDATKEMAYIPLDDEMKTKGKAAVDIVGTKIGKAGGAILQFMIFTIFPYARYDDIAGFLMSLFLIICMVWVMSVHFLSKEYTRYETRH